MMLLMGDVVTVTREVGDDLCVITGRVSGLVQRQSRRTKVFPHKGNRSCALDERWLEVCRR